MPVCYEDELMTFHLKKSTIQASYSDDKRQHEVII
jgi:hypothetical protein